MSTPPTPSTQHTTLQAARVMGLAFAGMIVLVGVAAVFSLGGLGEYPSPVVSGVLFLLNLAAFGLIELVGYRTPAAPADDPEAAWEMGLAALRSSQPLRLAVAEAPALLALAWSFIEGSAWVYLVGAVWALLSILWHGYPSRRVLERLERNLDREGGRSRLTELVDEPAARRP